MKAMALFVAHALILSNVAIAQPHFPDHKLAPKSRFTSVQRVVPGVRDDIVFNMKDRGLSQRGDDERKWTFWRLAEESRVYSLTRNVPEICGILNEIIGGSYDMLVEEVKDRKVKPERFTGRVSLELFYEGEEAVITVSHNGKQALDSQGRLIRVFKNPKEHFGGIGHGRTYVQELLSLMDGSLQWRRLQDGARAEIRIPRTFVSERVAVGETDYITIEDDAERVYAPARIVNGICTSIEFNMRTREVRGPLDLIFDAGRKRAFWAALKGNPVFERIKEGLWVITASKRNALIELCANSYDSFIDRINAQRMRPETFTGRITLEAYYDGQDAVIRIIDNGKTIDFKKDGTPGKRRSAFGHFRGGHRAIAGIQGALREIGGSMRWYPLERGTMTEIRVPKDRMTELTIAENDQMVLEDRNDAIDWGRETVRSVRAKETLGASFRNRVAFRDISILIGQYLHLGISPHTLIPEIKKHVDAAELAVSEGPRDVLLAGYRIDEMSYREDENAYYLPLYRDEKPTYSYRYSIDGDESDADMVIPLGDGTCVYVNVVTRVQPETEKTERRPATPEELKKRFTPPEGQHLIKMERRGAEIEPEFSDFTLFESRFYEWFEFDDATRNAVVVPLYERKVPITSFRKTDDWDAMPDGVKEYLEKGILLVTAHPQTTTLKKSPYSILMYKGSSELYKGRTGILLKDGVPVIGEFGGKEFMLKAKGIGVADEGFTSAHVREGELYEITGGYSRRESVEEFERLERDRNESRRFAEGELPRAACEVHFALPEANVLIRAMEWDGDTKERFRDEFRGQVAMLFTWTPSTRRASFGLKKGNIEKLGRLAARTLPDVHQYPHPENVLVWGEDDGHFCFTDRGHIIPVLRDPEADDFRGRIHILEAMSLYRAILGKSLRVSVFGYNAPLYVQNGAVKDEEEFFDEFMKGYIAEAEELGFPGFFIEGLRDARTVDELVDCVWNDYFTITGYLWYQGKGYFESTVRLNEYMYDDAFDILLSARACAEKGKAESIVASIDADAAGLVRNEDRLLRAIAMRAHSGLIMGKQREVYIVTDQFSDTETAQYEAFVHEDMAPWLKGLDGALTVTVASLKEIKRLKPDDTKERLFIMSGRDLQRGFKSHVERVPGRTLLLEEPVGMGHQEQLHRIPRPHLFFAALGLVCLEEIDLPVWTRSGTRHIGTALYESTLDAYRGAMIQARTDQRDIVRIVLPERRAELNSKGAQERITSQLQQIISARPERVREIVKYMWESARRGEPVIRIGTPRIDYPFAQSVRNVLGLDAERIQVATGSSYEEMAGILEERETIEIYPLRALDGNRSMRDDQPYVISTESTRAAIIAETKDGLRWGLIMYSPDTERFYCVHDLGIHIMNEPSFRDPVFDREGTRALVVLAQSEFKKLQAQGLIDLKDGKYCYKGDVGELYTFARVVPAYNTKTPAEYVISTEAAKMHLFAQPTPTTIIEPPAPLSFDQVVEYLQVRPGDQFMYGYFVRTFGRGVTDEQTAHLIDRFIERPSTLWLSLICMAMYAGNRQAFQFMVNYVNTGEYETLAVEDELCMGTVRRIVVEEYARLREIQGILRKNKVDHAPLTKEEIRAVEEYAHLAGLEPAQKRYVHIRDVKPRKTEDRASLDTGMALRDVSFEDAMERLNAIRPGIIEKLKFSDTKPVCEPLHDASVSYHLRLFSAAGGNIYSAQEDAKNFGKGTSRTGAILSAAYEMLERVSARMGVGNDWPKRYKHDMKLVKARYSELVKREEAKSKGALVLDPNRLNVDVPYKDEELHWVAGTARTSKGLRRIFIPAQCVFFLSNFAEPGIKETGTNGLASGNTLLEAKLQGLLEIFERDAQRNITFYHPERCFTIPADDSDIGSLIAHYEKRGIRIQFMDCTTEFGVPVYKAFIKVGDQVIMGCGAHLNSRIAVRRALGEVIPNIGVYENRAGEIDVQRLDEPATMVRTLENLPDYSTQRVRTDLDRLERLLIANAYEPMYVDLTHRDIGIPVVRVTVPGLGISDTFSAREYASFRETFIELPRQEIERPARTLTGAIGSRHRFPAHDDINALFLTIFPEWRAFADYLDTLKDRSGREGAGYHSFEHGIEVKYLAYLVGIVRGLSGTDLLEFVVAATLHDFDIRAEGERPRIERTIEQIRKDGKLGAILADMGLDRDAVYLLIERTDHEWDEEKGARWEERVTVLGDSTRSALVRQSAELLQCIDKASTYLCHGCEETFRRVQELMREEEKSASRANVFRETQRFFASLTQEEEFERILTELPGWARENWNENYDYFTTKAPGLRAGKAERDLLADKVKLVAAKEKEPLIIALGTDWIKGYEKERHLQYDALNPLITSIRHYCERRGIPFIAGRDREIIGRIAAKRREDGFTDAKVVVLADSGTVTSAAFETLRNDEQVFLAGVDNEYLTVDSYMYLMEMLTMALGLAYDRGPGMQNPDINVRNDEAFTNVYIFTPQAEPMDYERLREIYRVQMFA